VKTTFLYRCACCGQEKEVEPEEVAIAILADGEAFRPEKNADLWLLIARRRARLHRCPTTSGLVYGVMDFVGFIQREA